MLDKVDFNRVEYVLEPSAGKGDICDMLKDRRVKIDVIEIESELQAALKGKEYNLIFNDFLSFETNKHYDLILANFPFSDGDKHLQKALALQERSGGSIVCLLNAETIKNPFSNLRKVLVQKLEEYKAEIEYLADQFTNAERQTAVEVALIVVNIPKKETSLLFEALKKEATIEVPDLKTGQVIERDFIKQLIARFNFECQVGKKIITEYFTLQPFMAGSLKKDTYDSPIIELKIEGASQTQSSCINSYIEAIRYKYWALLLNNELFRERYTSNLLKDLHKKQAELRSYDFNEFNIQKLQDKMGRQMSSAIEKTILDLFDELSYKYTFHEEFGKNIHYYNGWKTNKAHKINKKVILPINGFSAYSYGKDKLEWRINEKMNDMVKVFNFLANEITEVRNLIETKIKQANEQENFRSIHFHYFTATFYKKGTCHITFLNDDLLAKFNIFGSQRKGWLPPSYGKKSYQEMEKEEQSVIENFQGKEEYQKVVKNPEYFLVNKALFLS